MLSQAERNTVLDKINIEAKREKTRVIEGKKMREHLHALQVAEKNPQLVKEVAVMAGLLPHNRSDPFFALRFINDCRHGHVNYLEEFNRVKQVAQQQPSFKALLFEKGLPIE